MTAALERLVLAAGTGTLPPPLDPALDGIVEEARLRHRRRSAWLLHRASAGMDDDVASEASWLASAPALDEIQTRLLEGRTGSARHGRPERLREVFGLGVLDWSLLRGALAVALDPWLAGALDADEGGVPEATLRRLFALGPGSVWGAAGAATDWQLLVPGEGRGGARVRVDPLVVEWLLGHAPLDPVLRPYASAVTPREPLSGWPVEAAAGWAARALTDPSVRARLVVAGPPGAGRRTFAACVAAQLGFPLLALASATHLPADVYLRARRQAFLDRVALAWIDASALVGYEPPTPDVFPLEVLICGPEDAPVPAPGRVEQRIDLPAPTVEDRARLWAVLVPQSTTWEGAGFRALVESHRSLPGEIAAVARTALPGHEDAARAVRAGARHRLGEVAQLVPTPFEWDDLVVDAALADALQDFVHEVRAREALWERASARRLFPLGRGVVALFSGPPGTGKTMAAQVVARAMGRDLFRVDLSAVVSKYVGETSRNLDRVLRRAAYTDALLLFDEADALFGRRTEIQDAHDRYANTDTDFLLQALESYDGVAVLATNRKGNVDPAFLRRLRFVLDFPVPDEALRARLWRSTIEALHGPPAGALDASVPRLAREVELTGAQVRGAVLTAAFRARRHGVAMAPEHLVEGIVRELRKEGRVVGERERARLVSRA